MPDLLLEIGTEELPPGDVYPAAAQLARAVGDALSELRLGARGVKAFGGPRRLAVLATGLSARQQPAERRIRGPAAASAFDAEGHPTPAAIGFARSQGIPVGALETTEDPGGRRYVVAVVREAGRPAGDVLPQALVRAAGALTFSKTMRWGVGEVRFARPIRWIVALLGARVLPVEIAGVRAGRTTFGHRTLHPGAVRLTRPARYVDELRRAGVVVEPQARRALITEQARRLAASAGGTAVLDPALVEELVMSVEHPHALLGAFDPRYLALPREVLITVMQHHQKYVAVEDGSRRLLPVFVAVRDGSARQLATVRQGHEWVLEARLADARFFFEEDRALRLEEYVPRLDRLTFLTQLGTVGEKTRRLVALARGLADVLRLDGASAQALHRAALLCKADLVTRVVGEFPELQGTVGQIYALLDGEAPEVARAIGEHYRPAGTDDGAPKTRLGGLLGLIDKMDTLVGALAVGLMPSGSQDPHGLRRAANGIVDIVRTQWIALDIRRLARLAYDGVRDSVKGANRAHRNGTDEEPEAVSQAVDLILQRLRGQLIDRGLRYDVVDAALAVSGDDLLAASSRADAVAGAVGEQRFAELYVGFDRASRIVTEEAAAAVDPGLFETDAERALFAAISAVRGPVREAARAGEFHRAMEALAPLVPPVNRIFDEVLIMVPDPRVRANRLALLREAAETFRIVADFSKIVMTDEEKSVAIRPGNAS